MNERIIMEIINPFVSEGRIALTTLKKIFNNFKLKPDEEQQALGIIESNNIIIEKSEGINGIDLLDIPDDVFVYDSKDNPSEEVFQFSNIKQSNEVLCSLIQEGNLQAENDICVKNKSLVYKYAKAYSNVYNSRLSVDDLAQAGYIGLMKAFEKFNTGAGFNFTTYAVYWIKQVISREIMDSGYTIRIPVHMFENIIKVSKISNELPYSLSPQERISLIADIMDCSEKDVEKYLKVRDSFIRGFMSLNTPIGESEDSELGDFIEDHDMPAPFDAAASTALREQLDDVLKTLTIREKKVLELRFGLEDGRTRTLEEVAAHFGVTRERVRQIEAKALRKLRHPSRSKRLKDFLE